MVGIKNLSALDMKKWKTIVPFPDKEVVAFMYCVKTKDKRIVKAYTGIEAPVYLIFTYYVHQSQQVFLPKLVPQITEPMQRAENAVNNPYIEEWATLYDIMKNVINKHLVKTSFLEKILNDVSLAGFQPSKYIEMKNFDQLIHALIVGKPVVISCDSEMIGRECLTQVLPFAFHRSLRISEYPVEPVKAEDVDVVVVKARDAKRYKDFVLVDVEKMQVKNGESNRFCEKLRKEVLSLQDPLIIGQFVKRKINWLLSKAALIRNASWDNSTDVKAIREIRSDLEHDAETIVLNLAEGNNSLLQSLLDELVKFVPADKLLMDSNFFKYNDHKVIVKGNLPTEQIRQYADKLLKLGITLAGIVFKQKFEKT